MEKRSNSRSESTSSTESILLINEQKKCEIKIVPTYDTWFKSYSRSYSNDSKCCQPKHQCKERNYSIDSQEKTPRINVTDYKRDRDINIESTLVKRRDTPTILSIEKMINNMNKKK